MPRRKSACESRAALIERDFGRHRSFGANALKRELETRERVAHRRVRRRRLVAAMRHAVGALLVAAGAVRIPVGRVHQFLERARIALAQQVARLLPAEDVARRHAPRRAVIGLVAGEEIEEEAGVHELPALAAAVGEDLAE